MLKKTVLAAAAIILMLGCAARAERELANSKFNADAAGEAILKVRLATPGYNWSKGAWSPPLEIRLDGLKVSSLIPFRGEEAADYNFILGPVEAGPHAVTLVDLSDKKREVTVEPLAAQVIPKNDPQYEIISHTPILLGRPENENSDVPLVFWYVVKPLPDGKVIDYSILWSNEDSGTPTARLMALYGRTVDIESVYTMTLDKSGAIVSQIIQGDEHVDRQFAGRKIGNHPILRTSSKNNMVDDTGDSPFTFAYLPLPFDEEGTRERMLDRQPWIYKIAYEELIKEDKLTRIIPDLSMNRIDDPRRYALVDLKTESFGSQLEVALKIRGKDKWLTADQGIEQMRLNRAGEARVGIWLPENVTMDKIEALRLTAYGLPSERVTIVSAGPVTFLDKEFRPIQMTFPWKKKEFAIVGGKPIEIKF